MRNRVRASLRNRFAYRLQKSGSWLLRDIGYWLDDEVIKQQGYEVYDRVTGNTFELFTEDLKEAMVIAQEAIRKGHSKNDITIGRCICYGTEDDILEIFSIDDMRPKFTDTGEILLMCS